MAAKITVRGWIVGSTTVYGYVTDNVTGYYWTGTVLEAYSAAHEASYKTALTQIGSTGDYTGTIAGTLPAGDYTRTARDGNSGFGADTFVGSNELAWNGSVEVYQTGDSYAALVTNTYAEPSAVPAATASLKDKLGWLFTLARNKRTTTRTGDTVRNDGDTANIATSTLSDDDSTFTRGKYS
jgi:hypothetical protein